jgi:hypothetical protein
VNEPKVILCSWDPHRPTAAVSALKAARAMKALSAAALNASVSFQNFDWAVGQLALEAAARELKGQK